MDRSLIYRRLCAATLTSVLVLYGCQGRFGQGSGASSPIESSTHPSQTEEQASGSAPISVTAFEDCGIDGVLALAFTIPAGHDYRYHFPAFGLSPELEGVSGATVVMYRGPATVRYMSGEVGSSVSAVRDDLVCVIVSGQSNLYADISREGMRLPDARHVLYVSDTLCDWAPELCAGGSPPRAEASLQP